MPPRPPLPQYYDSVERPPHHRVAPHRPEERKAGPRNGAHSVSAAGKPPSPPCVCVISIIYPRGGQLYSLKGQVVGN